MGSDVSEQAGLQTVVVGVDSRSVLAKKAFSE
jgi:hypothetical protein